MEQKISDEKRIDFVKDLQETIMSDIPFTNKFWCEDIAIGLLSTLSANIEFSTRIGKVPMNIWVMGISQSSRGYKSPPLNNFMRPILKQVEEESSNLEWKLILPSSFSIEGMTEYLSKETNRGIIIHDEISQLFKETQGKGYTISLMDFLDRLFDGVVEPRYTRQYKLEEVNGRVNVSLIGATTPSIYHILDHDTFMSGFGMRFLYELWEPCENISYNTNNLFNLEDSNNRDEILKKYVKPLSNVYSKDRIAIKVDDDVRAHFAKCRDSLEKLAQKEEKNHNQNLANYIEKVSLYLFKLAPLFALSREFYSLPKEKEIEITVTKEDVDRAYNKVKRHIDNFDLVLRNWNLHKNTKMVEIQNYDAVYDSIITYIKEAGGAISRKSLCIKMGWIDNENLTIRQKYLSIFEILSSQGRIKKLTNEELLSIPKEKWESIGINLLDKNN